MSPRPRDRVEFAVLVCITLAGGVVGSGVDKRAARVTNPCLCGFSGSTLKQCRCSPLQIENYLGKISGPLLDRIAIHVTVQPVDVEMWRLSCNRMTSADMRDLVTRAREIQRRRFEGVDGIDCNARLPEGLISTFCAREPSAETLFIRAQKALLASARARGYIARVALTIADIEGSETISERHVAEAIGYRAMG